MARSCYPFAEWQEYLEFEARTNLEPIKGQIEKHQQVEFQFIKDLTSLLTLPLPQTFLKM